MSDNSKNTSGTENGSTNYRKKSNAVERLLNADKKTYPKTKADPGKKYRSGGLIDRIPSPIKALFIKFWFNGAVCFFIYWGLGMYIWNTLDMIVVLGLIMGMVTDILVNNAFRFFAVTSGDNDKWMMFPKKKFWTFFANMAYALVIMFIVAWIYNFTNILLNILSGTTGTVFIGVEPVLFGILYVAVDMLFIGMKRLVISIISDAKKKVDSK